VSQTLEKILTVNKAKTKFLRLLDQVEDSGQVIITKSGVPIAALVNFEELQTLKALTQLWQDPEALRAMQQSLKDAKKGKVIKLSGAPTVEKILFAARKKGLKIRSSGKKDLKRSRFDCKS
jgi:prevent-host-death family protein